MSGGSRRSSRDEALEQQIVALGIDRGDAEHVADGANWRPSRGPGRGCPWLRAKRTIEFTVRKYGAYCSFSISRSSCSSVATTLVGHAFGIALGRAFPGQLLQRLLRRQRRIVRSSGY